MPEDSRINIFSRQIIVWSVTGRSIGFMAVLPFCGLVYVLGIPLVQLMLLCRNKRDLHEENARDPERHRLLQKQFRSIYEHYVPEYYYFDFVDLFRRAIMTGGLVLLGEHSVVQSLLGITVCIAWATIVAWLLPYKTYLDNVLSVILSLGLLMSLVSGFTLEMYRVRHVIDGIDEDNQLEQIVFDWLLMLLTIGCIVFGIVALLLSTPRCRRAVSKIRCNKTRTNKGRHELDSKATYCISIGYHQKT